MRHRKSGVKLNRSSSHRQAMFRNMVTSLFKYDRIKTTDAKAKELRRWADHIVTLAKRGDLHARRLAMSIVREKDVVHKIFEEASDRFGSINGGYTRIIKIGRRPGDAASVTLVELVSADEARKTKVKRTQPKTQVKSVAAEMEPVEKTPTETGSLEPAPETEAVQSGTTDVDQQAVAVEAEGDDSTDTVLKTVKNADDTDQ